MKLPVSLLFALPAFALTLAQAPDAAACGGCFHGEGENTQVAGHRMALSVSKNETTLWDQISYAGNPTSFAWVLPVKGTVTIGLSSDALFEQLDQLTQVQVGAPPLNCPAPPSCYNGSGGGLSTTTGTDGDAGGVTVIAQSVVGPYETVQLSSTDPAALTTWLTAHGYVIPPDVATIVDKYVGEGFDFLALKLVPGAGVDSMKPVRVTTPGAAPVLPLRMVAAGTGVMVPVTLWVLGEGRYEPTNFPWFVITEDQLSWDFATSSSNYKQLRQDGFTATSGKGWLLETSTPTAASSITGPLTGLAQYDPTNSGYADDTGQGATDACAADLDKLVGTISATALWVTRMRGELPRTALDADLTLGASTSQAELPQNLVAKHATNIPECPTYPPCEGSGGSGGNGGAGGSTTSKPSSGSGKSSDGGCAVGRDRTGSAAFVGVGLAVALAFARRRRG